MFIKRFLLFFLIIVIQKEATSQIINEIATKVSGYEIPILIHLPSNNEVTKSPVYFFVHGGGWNGGDENLVPNARLPADSDFLVNNLGIIYVGLAYRCKGNNATFENAIEELDAYSASNTATSAMAKGVIGDAFAELGQMDDAADFYQQAAKATDNNFTTPLFLWKAGLAFEADGKSEKAVKLYEKIANDYPDSRQAAGIEGVIAALK